jgi:predicted SprT family Zn-dependent metalloprotease
MATVRAPIPRKMRVGNKQYSVEIVEAMLEKKRMGHVHYPTQTIKLGLRSNVSNKKYAENVLQETFWHEVTHAILHDMGRDTLNRDEKFVTEFAHRLAKAIRTARF